MQAILQRRAHRSGMIALHQGADKFAENYWKSQGVEHYPVALETFITQLQQHWQ